MTGPDVFIASWQTFYATLGSACAGFIGLLFLAFTFKSELLMRKSNKAIRSLLQKLFSDFVLIMLISFFFLIPHQTAFSLGLSIGITAFIWVFNIIRSLIRSWDKRNEIKKAGFAKSYIGTLLGAIGLLIESIFLMLGNLDLLYWCVAPILFVLFSAGSSVWTIMTSVEEEK